MKYKHVFFLGGWLLRVVLAVVLLLLFSACTMNISFEGRLVQLLGNISYEFYLGHLVVISIVSRLFSENEFRRFYCNCICCNIDFSDCG